MAQVFQRAQAGAVAWGAARAAGKSLQQADYAFNAATINASGMAGLFQHGAILEQGRYLIQQMCPQFYVRD